MNKFSHMLAFNQIRFYLGLGVVLGLPFVYKMSEND